VVIHATGNSCLTHLLSGHQAQHVAADNGHSSSVILHPVPLPAGHLNRSHRQRWPSTIDLQTAI